WVADMAALGVARTRSKEFPMKASALALLAAVALAPIPMAASAQARTGDQPVRPLPAAPAPKTDAQTKSASLPARGLFDGDKLSPLARQKLTDLVIDAIGLQVDVALVVPTG